MTTTKALDVARANFHAALREESEALANAQQAVETSGSVSAESAKTMRAAQMAHARSNASFGELRALTADAGRGEAGTPAPANPPLGGTHNPDC